jgi:hypothetical protein
VPAHARAQPAGVVALVDQPPERGDLLDERAIEDLRPLAFIQRRGLRAAGIASGRGSTQARTAPLDVPATRWKRPAIGRRLRRSISATTNAGINPRIPPPSIASTRAAAQRDREPLHDVRALA